MKKRAHPGPRDGRINKGISSTNHENWPVQISFDRDLLFPLPLCSARSCPTFQIQVICVRPKINKQQSLCKIKKKRNKHPVMAEKPEKFWKPTLSYRFSLIPRYPLIFFFLEWTHQIKRCHSEIRFIHLAMSHLLIQHFQNKSQCFHILSALIDRVQRFHIMPSLAFLPFPCRSISKS